MAGLARGSWPVVDRRRRHRAGAYGFVATFQPDPHFGRILAAYGGFFVAGSLAWGVVVDKFRPDR
jgi:drug/metabolite transporter superfamily protein YnfA